MLYDRFMLGVDRGAWADYLLKLLPPGILSIADCACGTGEITQRLAAAGHRVTGLDISESMLAVAQEKARRMRLKIPFVCQDMRFLALHRPVDAVIAACDGVNYLTSLADVRSFFAAAAKALKPGGVLAFDVSSRYKLSTVLGQNTFGEDEADAAYIWKNAYDRASKLICMELTFFSRMDDGRYRRFTEQHVQRAHAQSELMAALERAGFCDIAVYGAFTLEAPQRTDERLQFVARKR